MRGLVFWGNLVTYDAKGGKMHKRRFIHMLEIPFLNIAKVVCLMVFLTYWTLGCGGGGGGGGNTTTTPATTNTFIIYSGEEILTYDYSYSASYSDGSGAVSSSGEETQYIYSGWSQQEITFPLYKL